MATLATTNWWSQRKGSKAMTWPLGPTACEKAEISGVQGYRLPLVYHWSTNVYQVYGCSHLSQGYSVAAQVCAHVDGHVSGSQQHLHLVALQMIHGALRGKPSRKDVLAFRMELRLKEMQQLLCINFWSFTSCSLKKDCQSALVSTRYRGHSSSYLTSHDSPQGCPDFWWRVQCSHRRRAAQNDVACVAPVLQTQQRCPRVSLSLRIILLGCCASRAPANHSQLIPSDITLQMLSWKGWRGTSEILLPQAAVNSVNLNCFENLVPKMPLRTATVTLVVTQTTVVAVVSSMPFGPGRLLRWWHLHVWLAVIHHDLGTLSQKTPRIIRTHPDFDVLSLKPSISYILFTSTSNFALSCAVKLCCLALWSCTVLRCEAGRWLDGVDHPRRRPWILLGHGLGRFDAMLMCFSTKKHTTQKCSRRLRAWRKTNKHLV